MSLYECFYCSTCFECYYIHPQEPATVIVLFCLCVYWCTDAVRQEQVGIRKQIAVLLLKIVVYNLLDYCPESPTCGGAL